MESRFSNNCLEVLGRLKEHRNVLITGAPGTGKSLLLSKVANAFLTGPVGSTPAPSPVHIPGAEIAIPKDIPAEIDTELQNVWPAPTRTNRNVFHTAFHQNSKYREFVSGLVPKIGDKGGFEIYSGILYRASEHAKLADGASLLIIDEINRGPAVQVFGGSIVAIEEDKRLAEDNSVLVETQFFELLDPAIGNTVEYALPKHLYILAAMNQADASVEPLDVAFLRRWTPYHLKPNSGLLRSIFGLAEPEASPLPETTTDHKVILEAAIRAWEAINFRIRLGRGAEFEIGHGFFLTGRSSAPADLAEALTLAAEVWRLIYAHIEEVFFGDLRGVAATLNVIGGTHPHQYTLNETLFADEPRLELIKPDNIDNTNIYSILRSVAE